MLHSGHFSKQLLFSPLVETLGSSMTNCDMGNSSEKITHMMDLTAESTQKSRRRKSATQYENGPEISQQAPNDSSRPNGISADVKTVSFSVEEQQNHKSLLLTSGNLEPNTWVMGRKTVPPDGNSLALSELEIKNLKDMVLLHLNIIQQQQETITEKNKKISELREESKLVSSISIYISLPR